MFFIPAFPSPGYQCRGSTLRPKTRRRSRGRFIDPSDPRERERGDIDERNRARSHVELVVPREAEFRVQFIRACRNRASLARGPSVPTMKSEFSSEISAGYFCARYRARTGSVLLSTTLSSTITTTGRIAPESTSTPSADEIFRIFVRYAHESRKY